VSRQDSFVNSEELSIDPNVVRAVLSRSQGGTGDDWSGWARDLGRLGEELAVEFLKQSGYHVLWVNEFEETGLPFDLLAVEQVRQGAVSPLDAYLGEDGRPSSEKIAALYKASVARSDVSASDSSVAFVEVKTSSKDWDGCQTSLPQANAMSDLGHRCWLLRIKNLASHTSISGDLSCCLWKEYGLALRQGSANLLLVA